MAAGHIYKCAYVCSINGNECVNVNFLKMLSAADVASTVVASWQTLYTNILAYQNIDVHQVRMEVRDLTVPPTGFDTPLTSVGGINDTNFDLATSMVVTLRTASLGRSYRGRNYLFGMEMDKLIAGIWDSTFKTNITSLYNTFLGFYGASGSSTDAVAGVWSRKLGDVGYPGPTTGYNLSAGFHPITSVTVQPDARTQRRRSVGIGS